MKFVHKPVVEGSEIFQAIRARFLQTLEEKNLGSRVELLEKLAELRHRVATGWNTENIMNESFNELLGDVFATQVPIRKFS